MIIFEQNDDKQYLNSTVVNVVEDFQYDMNIEYCEEIGSIEADIWHTDQELINLSLINKALGE